MHRILLVTGGGAHDFAQGRTVLRKLLDGAGFFEVEDAFLTEQGVEPFARLGRDRFDAVVMYTQGGAISKAQEDGLIGFVESGGGLVGVHCANDTFRDSPRFASLIGSRFKTHPPGLFDFSTRFTDEAKAAGHPLAVRIDDFVLSDEHYIIEAAADFDVFAVSDTQGGGEPMGYTRRQGEGTVVYLANGHHPEALSNPHLQHLLERSLRLACRETLDTNRSASVGLLGYGAAFGIGAVHAKLIAAQAGLSTAAVCDLDPACTERARQELGPDIRTCNDMDGLLADDGVDVVVVALPHNLHASATIAALGSGKHVVCEKPMCLTLEEADRIIAAAEKARHVVCPFHCRRWDASFLTLLDATQGRGAIGDVFHVEVGCGGYRMGRPWWRDSRQISGGALYDWGAHFMDCLLQLMPRRIASVSGNLQKRNWHTITNEDFAQVHLRFEDGTTANLEQGTLSAIPRPAWRILGQRGGIELDDRKQDEPMLVQFDGDRRRETTLPLVDGHWTCFYKNLANHLFLGERLIVTPQQARRVVGVLELAEKSSALGGRPLELPGEQDFEPSFDYPL